MPLEMLCSLEVTATAKEPLERLGHDAVYFLICHSIAPIADLAFE